MSPRLCLGTAQFGSPYGVTNLNGKVSELEVINILTRAHHAGISLLDTAQVYGDSESVLGRSMRKGKNFHVITKLPAQVSRILTERHISLWEKAFFSSLNRLSLSKVDSLLLHSPADLLKPGFKYLETWLLSLKERRLVNRIGISIYSANDLNNLNLSILDLVQMPLSLFDQRLLQDGTIALLRSQDVAIHIRSVYLQGLLLTPSYKWPQWAPKKFLEHHVKLEVFAFERKCNLIDLVLGFAKNQLDVEAVVLGVCSVHEFNELINIWANPSPWTNDEWTNWAFQDDDILDPRTWLK